MWFELNCFLLRRRMCWHIINGLCITGAFCTRFIIQRHAWKFWGTSDHVLKLYKRLLSFPPWQKVLPHKTFASDNWVRVTHMVSWLKTYVRGWAAKLVSWNVIIIVFSREKKMKCDSDDLSVCYPEYLWADDLFNGPEGKRILRVPDGLDFAGLGNPVGEEFMAAGDMSVWFDSAVRCHIDKHELFRVQPHHKLYEPLLKDGIRILCEVWFRLKWSFAGWLTWDFSYRRSARCELRLARSFVIGMHLVGFDG